MVKRYDLGDEYMAFVEDGEYVLYSDYQDLQRALGDSLKNLEDLITLYPIPSAPHHKKVISQLRTQYLGEFPRSEAFKKYGLE